MISFNELGRGVRIVLDNDPYEIMETTHMVKGRGKSVLQAKVKNLRTGNLLSKTFRPSESFEEADTSKTSLKFLYKNRGQYFFCEDDNPVSYTHLDVYKRQAPSFVRDSFNHFKLGS